VELRTLLEQVRGLGMTDLQYSQAQRRLLAPLCKQVGLTPDELARVLGLLDESLASDADSAETPAA